MISHTTIKQNGKTLICEQAWNSPVVNLANGQILMCCKSTEFPAHPQSEVHFTTKDSFTNHPNFLQRRQALSEGVPHPDCSICWRTESQKLPSYRTPVEKSIKTLQERDVISQLQNGDQQISLKSNQPRTLEIRLGRVCNLKCVYCESRSSTEWEREEKKFGATLPPLDLPLEEQVHFEEKFLTWFEEVFPTLESITLTGGEPVMNPSFSSFVKLAAKAPPSNQRIITIFTNGSMNEAYLSKMIQGLDLVSQTSRVKLRLSIEAIGKRAEYIRHGMSWKRLTHNLDTLLEWAKAPSFGSKEVILHMTHNALSLPFLHEIVEFAGQLKSKHNLKIAAGFNMIVDPDIYSLKTLSPDLLKNLPSAIDQIRSQVPEWENVALFAERVIKQIETFQSHEDLKKNLWFWIQRNDFRRGTDFFEVFPEFKDHFQKYS